MTKLYTFNLSPTLPIKIVAEGVVFACGKVAICDLSSPCNTLIRDQLPPEYLVKAANALHTFVLQRIVDDSGVSGTGTVTEGMVFSCGKVVLCWLVSPHGIDIYDNIGEMLQVHGHQGSTIIEWLS